MNRILFDKAVYSLEAVKRAAYDLPKECCPQVSTSNEVIMVQLTNSDVHEKELVHRALDHQLQLDAEEQYGLIRTILVAQAIEPRGDLDAIVDSISPSE